MSVLQFSLGESLILYSISHPFFPSHHEVYPISASRETSGRPYPDLASSLTEAISSPMTSPFVLVLSPMIPSLSPAGSRSLPMFWGSTSPCERHMRFHAGAVCNPIT